MTAENFQERSTLWARTCFRPAIVDSPVERNHRFVEESLELVQSLGCTRDEVLILVNYVFDRPIGEPKQEVGGVMNTLALLCSVHDIDLEIAAETELIRCWDKIEAIRAKQKAKPILP